MFQLHSCQDNWKLKLDEMLSHTPRSQAWTKAIAILTLKRQVQLTWPQQGGSDTNSSVGRIWHQRFSLSLAILNL